MASQSASATVFRVTRIVGLSISQLYFASIIDLLQKRVAPGVPYGFHRINFCSYIRTRLENVPLILCECWPGALFQVQVADCSRRRQEWAFRLFWAHQFEAAAVEVDRMDEVLLV